jgi:hypothetical protein
MEKSELLARIRLERVRLEAAVDRTPDSARSEPVMESGWSIKTVLAHIATWERLTLLRLEAARQGTKPEIPPIGTEVEIDAVNAGTLESVLDLPIATVRADFDTVHAELVTAIEALDEEFLRSALPAAWGRGRKVWELIGANTWWHYPEHSQAIEAWLRTV